MNDNSWSNWESWLITQKQSLSGSSPHIFTYALGAGADEAIPKQLACENKGWYAKVNDGDVASLKHAMIRYFEYFANKIRLATHQRYRAGPNFIKIQVGRENDDGCTSCVCRRR